MYQIDNATAATSQPASTPAGTAGFFTDGNPATSVPATIVPAEWLNAVMMELVNVVTAGGLTPSKSSFNQVLTALNNMHSPAVGSARNAKMNVSAASANGTFSADSLIVATGLSGQSYRLANFNKTINLATVGAGGMDVGAAPNSGFVALYAIYNPTTGASALLGRNATSTAQSEVYGGANMPAGYTASALVSVWPTTSGGLLDVAAQVDRDVFTAVKNLYTGAGNIGLTMLSLSTAVPLNARVLFVSAGVTPSASGNIATVMCSTNSGVSAPGYTAFQGGGTNL